MKTKRISCEIEVMLPQAKEFSEARGKAWIRSFPSERAWHCQKPHLGILASRTVDIMFLVLKPLSL